MNKKKKIAVAGIALLFLSNPAAAQKWGAHVDVEAKPGSKRNLGEADFFLPLWQDGRTLMFGNLRLRIADHDNKEGNLGVGVRRMLDGGWNLGAYGYFDRRQTSTGSKFNQATFGAEALGQDWEFRGNAYVPQGDRVRDLGTTTVGGTPTAAIVGTTVQVTTPGSTTFASEERALKGYDLEAGWRAPVWAVEADKQLRLYVGGYRFSDSTAKVSGPRVRAELTMAELPALWKGAQLTLGAEYQDDNSRGSQSFVSVRLRIPLGGEQTSGRKMNWQERRMTAPTVRDVDVVTQARSVVTGSTPAVVEAATATASGQPLTVLASGTTTGAALPGAVAVAGANSTVVLSGTFNTIATTTLQAGQTLMGAGTLTVRTPSGRTAAMTTPSANIVSNLPDNASTVEMAAGSTLLGMNISHTVPGQGTGVRAIGVNNITIANNTINISTVAPYGIYIQNAGNFSVRANTVTASGTLVGIGLAADNANGTLRDNRFNALSTGGAAIGLLLASGGTVVSGNSLTGSGNNPGNSVAVEVSNANILAGSSGNTASGICSVTAPGTGGTITFTNAPPCGP